MQTAFLIEFFGSAYRSKLGNEARQPFRGISCEVRSVRWESNFGAGLVHDFDHAQQQLFLDSEKFSPITRKHIGKDIDVKRKRTKTEKIHPD